MNESLKRLEEKIAYLERHVVEQDKAMLAPAQAGEGNASSGDERPPHY